MVVQNSSVDFSAKNIPLGLAVDIDETLSWTIGYWVEEMQKKFGNPENLTIREMVEKYRYTNNVPYWQSKEALDWMDHHRNSDEVQEMLPLIEDAPVFLNKINKIIPISAYITIRPEKVMNGTKKWLKKHNFPETILISRPKEVSFEDSSKWKANIIRETYPKIQGIIDDNPSILKFLDSDYKGTIFLYNHGEIKSNAHVIACKDWATVYEKVKNHFSTKIKGGFNGCK